jgi:hypothetical protein
LPEELLCATTKEAKLNREETTPILGDTLIALQKNFLLPVRII